MIYEIDWKWSFVGGEESDYVRTVEVDADTPHEAISIAKINATTPETAWTDKRVFTLVRVHRKVCVTCGALVYQGKP